MGSLTNDFLPTRTFDLHVLPAHVPPPILPKSQYQPQISLLEGNVAPKLAYLKAKLPLTLILTPAPNPEPTPNPHRHRHPNPDL